MTSVKPRKVPTSLPLWTNNNRSQLIPTATTDDELNGNNGDSVNESFSFWSKAADNQNDNGIVDYDTVELMDTVMDSPESISEGQKATRVIDNNVVKQEDDRHKFVATVTGTPTMTMSTSCLSEANSSFSDRFASLLWLSTPGSTPMSENSSPMSPLLPISQMTAMASIVPPSHYLVAANHIPLNSKQCIETHSPTVNPSKQPHFKGKGFLSANQSKGKGPANAKNGVSKQQQQLNTKKDHSPLTPLSYSSSNDDEDDDDEYTDANETVSAPTEILSEFLSDLMTKDYVRALHHCKTILHYEPNNVTANEFYPLIVERIQQLDEMCSDDDSSSCFSTEEEISGKELGSVEDDDDDDVVAGDGTAQELSGSTSDDEDSLSQADLALSIDETTESYSSIDDDDEDV